MKKIIATLLAGTMLSGTAFAGINPKNIDESSSAKNIYKAIEKEIAEGKKSGIDTGFAWVEVNGKVYSVSLRELRTAIDPAAKFAEIVKEEAIAVDLEKTKEALATLKGDVFTAVIDGGVSKDLLKIAQARVSFLEARADLLEQYMEINATGNLTSEAIEAQLEGYTKDVRAAHADYLGLVNDYVETVYQAGVDAGVASVEGEDVSFATLAGVGDTTRTITLSNGNSFDITYDSANAVTAGDVNVANLADVADRTTTVTLSNGATAIVTFDDASLVTGTGILVNKESGQVRVTLSNGTIYATSFNPHNTITIDGLGTDRGVLVAGNGTIDVSQEIAESINAVPGISGVTVVNGAVTATTFTIDGTPYSSIADITDAVNDLQDDISARNTVIDTVNSIIDTRAGTSSGLNIGYEATAAEVTRALNSAFGAHQTRVLDPVSVALTGDSYNDWGWSSHEAFIAAIANASATANAANALTGIEIVNAAGQNQAEWIAAATENTAANFIPNAFDFADGYGNSVTYSVNATTGDISGTINGGASFSVVNFTYNDYATALTTEGSRGHGNTVRTANQDNNDQSGSTFTLGSAGSPAETREATQEDIDNGLASEIGDLIETRAAVDPVANSLSLNNQTFVAITERLGTEINSAIEAAYSDGYDDGYAEGYADGYEDGFADGRSSNHN